MVVEDRTTGYRPGQVVTATMGREAGRPFVVAGLDGDRLLLADGKKRPLSRPKRKNPRHVRPVAGHNLPEGSSLTDEAVRQALSAVEEEG